MATAASLDDLHFQRPPINEVVCGLMFEPLREFVVPHLGLLWEKYKPAFDASKEQPPLIPHVESGTASEEVQISEMPLFPRVWFEETGGNGLIQVQRDRFHYNWRRKSADDEYPHFENVYELFKQKLDIFTAFIGAIRPEGLTVKQLELTYVNHIDNPEICKSASDMGNVFSIFSWDQHDEEFRPESINWRMSFLLPNEEGRLHATVRSATRVADNKQVLLFDLTARGIGKDQGLESIDDWFKTSHGFIVNAFVKLTTKHMQENVWGMAK